MMLIEVAPQNKRLKTTHKPNKGQKKQESSLKRRKRSKDEGGSLGKSPSDSILKRGSSQASMKGYEEKSLVFTSS